MEVKAYFEQIRTDFLKKDPAITIGKMMSSEAIHFKGKVFAFLSTKGNMVFKLGKGFDVSTASVPLQVFSPFKSKKPLSGWYQLDNDYKDSWYAMTEKALQLIQTSK